MTNNLKERIRTTLSNLGADPDLAERRNLPMFDDAEDLVAVGINASGKEHLLSPHAAAHWQSLAQSAADDGISIYIVSAYRGFDRQTQVIRSALDRSRSLESVFSNIAPPGCSEHHTGRAVDVGTNGCAELTETFEQTAAYEWLVGHAARFGFRLSFPRYNKWGYAYEPWHWCCDHE